MGFLFYGGNMTNVSEARLRVWIYQELMGILSERKKRSLLEALNKKELRGELDSLERRIWTATKLYDKPNEQREFLKKELKAWEKRTAP